MGQGGSKISDQDKAVYELKKQRDNILKYQARIQHVSDRQLELAKELLKSGLKERAKFYLGCRRHQEHLVKKSFDQLENIGLLINTIEFKLIERDVIYGLKVGNQTLQQLNSEFSVEKIDSILDDLEDNKIQVEQVLSLLGSLTNGEERDVDEELERLEQELGTKEEVKSDLPEMPDVPNREHMLPTVPDTEPESEQEEKKPEEAVEQREAILNS
ncbi:Vacuolar protein sorting-associated protein 20 [Scheffersomyces spartinae]|uniref:Vacuolar protein sorting-associated protein 20 n=1 Tax=Scheffersomyces spartinae TaxID=45513 RepID=A0A9P7V5C0_9ASCO|nr:Vacuolar protein sorting-associated protein 20 [Scheffersomyces spartinae]KAG7191488.1 Vacuolar protein sorting-associated protein 20 [Scheffersomyces spartinae]